MIGMASAPVRRICQAYSMRAIDRLSQPQRVVIVVALGLVLAVAGSFVTSLGSPATGWFAYSPLTSGVFTSGPSIPSWLSLIIWLVLIAVWAAASIRLLKPSPAGDA
jgi:heme/copper-type cytochrome/quinol oxidase subunit 1